MESKHILDEKEKLVLESIIKNFIVTAAPVGSNMIARKPNMAFSPATIRGIMARLERKGYIYQPFTSSGRVPTTAGYRLFVDQMMKRGRISSTVKEKIRQAVELNPGDFENLLRESSRILAHLSNQLSIIISPHLDEGIFHNMEIIRLNRDRILLVVSIKSGLVKTIMLEVQSNIRPGQIDSLKNILNERLHGLKLKEIRNEFKEIVKDIDDNESGLIHVFINSAKQIFNFSENNEVFLTGTHNMLRQPEFADNHSISQVVEILENKNIIVHLLNMDEDISEPRIRIGDEIETDQMKNCSIIMARYRIDMVTGTLGIVGPTRMDYSHLVPLVDFVAHIISDSFQQN